MKNGAVEKLKKQFAGFKEKKEELSQSKNQLGIFRAKFNQLQKEKQSLAGKIKKAKNHFREEEASCDLLGTERKSLFGEKQPETERLVFQQLMSKKQADLEELRKEREQEMLQLSEAESVLTQLRKRFQKEELALKNLVPKLDVKSKKLGFENLESLQKAILDSPVEKRLRKQEKDLRDDVLRTRQTFENTVKELKKEQKKKLTILTFEELNEDLQQKESAYQMLLEQIGGLKKQLDENERRRRSQKALLEERDQQQKEFLRWEKLRSIIGSHDGKEYRSFAQGLTLQRLVQLANKHLQTLSGRYRIRKRLGKDLELEVIDTFQADNARSMNTLSGGESFLVSLALALGLSDLAGRNTNIRSLFIDEGFGSLDEMTLDLAISTLENLQAKGKTIGIISHVKELKERISTQIQVVKKASGFSEIEIVG
jgi:DNA repair protein SbcC/Rad50